MQLFNTKVIPSLIDAAWSPPALPDWTNARLLVITKPLISGSAEEATLHKMMAACKLSVDEYSVLQIADGVSYSWQAISGANVPASVLLLGITPLMLSIQARFVLHAPNAFAGVRIIPALSLEEIERNPAAKKELWINGLKPLFGL